MTTATATRRGLTGNDAVALAWRQINPDVVAAYPITPSTQVVERFSQYVADGAVTTQFIPVESEHSAISACVGASASGARVMTATSSQGLALMHEVLYIAAGLRLPIVMAVANRALSAPINIHGDHSDTMGSRDAGWIQLYARDVQEAYDLTILGVRIAERARLPLMVCLDGFTLSHSLEAVDVLPDEAVSEFVGKGPPGPHPLLTGEPITIGPLALPDTYMEFRRAQADAMVRALGIIEEESSDYNRRFGRRLPVFLETFAIEEADSAILLLGSNADTVQEAAASWRAAGSSRAGVIRLVAFRPFPAAALRRALAHVGHVVVMERADTLSTLGGPLGVEVRAALYGGGPHVTNIIYGLGGRELRDADLIEVRRLLDAGGGVHYLGLEEET